MRSTWATRGRRAGSEERSRRHKKVQFYLEPSLSEDLARASQFKAAQRCQLRSNKDVTGGRRELVFILPVSEGKVSSLLCEHYLSSEFCLRAFAFRRLFIFHSSLGFLSTTGHSSRVTLFFLRLIHSSSIRHLDVLKSCSTLSVEHRCSFRRYLAIEQVPNFYSLFFYPIFYVELRISCEF